MMTPLNAGVEQVTSLEAERLNLGGGNITPT